MDDKTIRGWIQTLCKGGGLSSLLDVKGGCNNIRIISDTMILHYRKETQESPNYHHLLC